MESVLRDWHWLRLALLGSVLTPAVLLPGAHADVECPGVSVPSWVHSPLSRDAAASSTPWCTQDLLTAPRHFVFGPAESFDVGPGTWAMVKGEFDGARGADFATANHGSSSITVRLSHGQQLMATRRDIPLGAAPSAICVADLNADGLDDLVVAMDEIGQVWVMTALGLGQFDEPRRYAVGPRPLGLATGDLDRDGDPDVAACNFDDNTVSVLRNRGDGTLDSAVTHFVGLGPVGIVCDDFNGDGMLDLATGDAACHTVSLLRGRGDGTFMARLQSALGNASVAALAVGDLDGDGDRDLAATSNSLVAVLRNDGTGRFHLAASHFVRGDDAVSLLIADMDDDGRPDVIVPSFDAGYYVLEASWITIFFNDGNAQLPSKLEYRVSDGPQQVMTIAPANHRTPDLLVVTNSEIQRFASEGDGRFAALVAHDVPSVYPWFVRVLSRPDRVRPDLIIGPRDPGEINFVPLTASDSIGTPVVIGSGKLGEVTDFNGDGWQDVVVDAEAGVDLALRQGEGFGPTRHLSDMKFFAAGDFDGDHFPDIALQGPGLVLAFLYNDGGRFDRYEQTTASIPKYALQASAGDLDGDGRADIVITGWDSLRTVIRQVDGSFRTASYRLESRLEWYFAASPRDLELVDLNLDGSLDVVVQNGSYDGARVSPLLNRGDGRLWVITDFYAGHESFGLATGDLDGDEYPDVVVADPCPVNTGYLRFQRSTIWDLSPRGSGGFELGGSIITGRAFDAATPDLDEDGLADIVCVIDSPSQLLTIFNRTPIASMPRQEASDIASAWSPEDTLLGATNAATPPGRARLSAPYPNPARSSGFMIGVELVGGGAGALELIDIAGRRVWSQGLDSGASGRHPVLIATPGGFAAGYYTLRLRQGGHMSSKPVVVR